MRACHVDYLVVARHSEWAAIYFSEIRSLDVALPLISIRYSSANISKDKARSISFSQGVEELWSIDPGRFGPNRNDHSETALVAAIGSRFAGGPAVSGQYCDDHVTGCDGGYTPYGGNVSVPRCLRNHAENAPHDEIIRTLIAPGESQ